MKILFIVPNPPSLVRVRPYNLIRYLAARGHEITIATLWSSSEEWQDIERLQADGFRVLAAPLGKKQILWNLLDAALTGKPLQANYCVTPELRGLLTKHLNGSRPVSQKPFDVIHVEHLRGAQYGLFVQKLAARHAIPVVWDSVDCISHLFKQAATRSRSPVGRLMARLELGRTQRYEGWLTHRFDQVLVTSTVDKEALDTLSNGNGNGNGNGARPPVTVLPNGVDLDYFAPQIHGRQPNTILFSGKMSYHANLTAAFYLIEEIMPAIWQRFPQAQAVIAGKDPPPALQKVAETTPNVHITGTVPDLRPYLQRATVAVSPILYGAGIQNKVLEAMACGTPIVASAQAASALSAEDGKHLLLAHNTQEFIHHLLRLLTDRVSQQCLSVGGRAYVEEFHSWDRIASKLEEIYCEGIERKTPL
jgi:glycosyltransferase involved in cell wall biosynthesis